MTRYGNIRICFSWIKKLTYMYWSVTYKKLLKKSLDFLCFCFFHHFIIALLSQWGYKVAFSLPPSLLSFLLHAFHSCCHGSWCGFDLSVISQVCRDTVKPTNLSFSLPFLLSFCFLPRSSWRTPADLLVFSAFYQREKGGAVSAVVPLSLTWTESDSGKALSQLS